MTNEADDLALTADLELAVAEYRHILTEAVRSCREHLALCDTPGCAGHEAIQTIGRLVSMAPAQAVGVLSLAVHYLAKREDLLEIDELEELLRDGGKEVGLLGHPDWPGGRK